MKTEKELVDWIYDLHLQNNTEHDTFEEAFKAGIECAIEELIELKKLRVTDVNGELVCTCGNTAFKEMEEGRSIHSVCGKYF